MDESHELITLFEKCLEALAQAFEDKLNSCFFTEQDIHFHFYHIYILTNAFTHHGYPLIHTKYPSPFKCSNVNDKPYIVLEPFDSQKHQSHIDFVLFNPSFITWLLKKNLDVRRVIGIGSGKVSLYVRDFSKEYAEFNRETGEAILLYAVEFEFLSYGSKYSSNPYAAYGIHHSIRKLRLLKTFSEQMTPKIYFVVKTKAMVFVDKCTPGDENIIQKDLEIYAPEEYRIITRKP